MIIPDVYDGAALARLNAELFGDRFKIHPRPHPTARANTGERYVIISMSGVRLEAEMCPMLSLTRDAAEKLMLQRIREYAADKTGTVYWRNYPEIDESVIFREDWVNPSMPFLKGPLKAALLPVPVYRGYARLLISDAPELEALPE